SSPVGRLCQVRTVRVAILPTHADPAAASPFLLTWRAMKTATRRFALWRADLEGGVCAAPEECVAALHGKNPIQLHLEHRVRGIAPIRETFASTLREDVEWRFEGIDWPADVQPGVLITVTWQAGKDEVVARTAALDEPLSIDGINYFHAYDPKVVTREFVL